MKNTETPDTAKATATTKPEPTGKTRDQMLAYLGVNSDALDALVDRGDVIDEDGSFSTDL